jgi:hypothetical protein
MAEVEKDNQVVMTADDVAQREEINEEVEQTTETVATEQPDTITLAKEEYEKALQSASSKKMNEFLKKYGARKLSDIEAKLEKAIELEKNSGKVKELEENLKTLQQKISEYEPIVRQKEQADFLQKNNIDPDYAEDFFVLYEKKLNADKSNSDEVIKAILEKHPNMSTIKVNDIKTSGGGTGQKDLEDKLQRDLNKMRRAAGLPEK